MPDTYRVTIMKKIVLSLILSLIVFSAIAQTVQTCGGCYGHGAVTCPSCMGYGQVSVFNYYYRCYVNQVCTRCAGYGVLVCNSCGGRGQVVVNNLNFRGKKNTPPNNSTDGYIYQGYTVTVKNKSYNYYRKNGHGYYWDGLRFVLYD